VNFCLNIEGDYSRIPRSPIKAFQDSVLEKVSALILEEMVRTEYEGPAAYHFIDQESIYESLGLVPAGYIKAKKQEKAFKHHLQKSLDKYFWYVNK
jgi:hypothetical protein